VLNSNDVKVWLNSVYELGQIQMSNRNASFDRFSIPQDHNQFIIIPS